MFSVGSPSSPSRVEDDDELVTSRTCGHCFACTKKAGFAKCGCFRNMARSTLLSTSFDIYVCDENNSTALNLLKEVAPHYMPLRIRSCHIGESVNWSMSDIFQLLSGTQCPANKVMLYRMSWPGRNLIQARLPDRNGTNQCTYVGTPLDVVLASLFATRRLKSEYRRFEITRLLLLHLCLPVSLLRDFQECSDSFQDLRSWMYEPGKEGTELEDCQNYQGDQERRIEFSLDEEDQDEAGEEDQMFDDNYDFSKSPDDSFEIDGDIPDPATRDDACMFLTARSNMPGSKHLYVAKCRSGLVKLGITDDLTKRLRTLNYKFHEQHTYFAVWENAGHLETLVKKHLKEVQEKVQAKAGGHSHEHFRCSVEHIINTVQAVDFEVAVASTSASRKRTMADVEEAKIRSQVEELDAPIRKAKLFEMFEEKSHELLIELVRGGDADAKKVFLVNHTAPKCAQ